jgi:hypothetical protein
MSELDLLSRDDLLERLASLERQNQESDPGRGSTFLFTLPSVDDEGGRLSPDPAQRAA